MTHFSYDHAQKYLDITAPQHVEIQLREDKTVLWVNVNGVCALRICRIESLKIEGFPPK